MGACHSEAFEKKTGLTLEELSRCKNVKVDEVTKIISFLPTKIKGSNYKQLFSNPITTQLTSDQIKETILSYTNHETGYCTTINLILAADGSKLKEHSDYIMKLVQSIKLLAYQYPCKTKRTYRGLWMTETEYNSYLEGEFQYIPSFLSTSRNFSKFYKNKGVNCLMIFKIECHPHRAFEVGKEFSKYEKEEEETLFSCYNKFKVVQKKKKFEFNGEEFEFGILLEIVNEDLDINSGKVFAVLNYF